MPEQNDTRSDQTGRLDGATAEYSPAVKGAASPIQNAETLPFPEQASPVVAAAPSLRRFGDYELLGEIARGGMGVVYKARQVSLNRVVALKMILSGQLASEAEVRRFQQEAEAAANLDHPNILPVYEVGEQQGQHYFSMKLLEGGSLAGKVQELVQKPHEAVRLVAVVARAVHHAHRRGVLHRDLKPANVLLDGDGRPCVADFGLARKVEAEGHTQSGTVVGTPAYMAPEQARGSRGLTTSADVYSLGAILYELLTGRTPFEGTAVEVLLRTIQEDPPPPRRVNPSLDADLEVVTMKCLEKEPARRYESAGALADDLERWLAREPILARPAGRWERLAKWARRRPAAAALLGVSLLATVLLVAGLVTGIVMIAGAKRDTDRALDREKEARGKLDDSLQREQRLAYLSHVGIADRYLVEGNITAALRLLDRCDRPELRGWEWHFLNHRGRGEPRTIRVGTQGEGRIVAGNFAPGEVPLNEGALVRAVAISPDGSLVASGRARSAVTIFDTATGERRAALLGHTGQVMAVAFSPDGVRLASVSGTPARKGEIKVWDVESGEELWSAPGSQACVAFSPDGRLVAAGAGKTVRVWNAALGVRQFVLTGSAGGVVAVAFSPDGKYLASADLDTATPGEGGHNVRVYDLAMRQQVMAFDGGHHFPQVLAFSPESDRLVWAASDRTRPVVWDLRKSAAVKFPGGRAGAEHRGGITAVTFSPDGSRMVTGSLDRTVRAWDVRTGEETTSWLGHTAAVWGVSFSRDGRRLATGAADGEIKLWDAETLPAAATLQPGTPRVSGGSNAAFSPDGRRVAASGGDGTVRIYDVSTGRAVLVLPDAGAPVSLAFSPDGGRLVAADGDLRQWDAVTGKRLADLVEKPAVPIRGVVFSPDGKLLAVTDEDGAVRLLDAGTGRETQSFQRKDERLGPVAFSPDGRSLAVCANRTDGSDRAVYVWDVESQKEVQVFRGHTLPMQCVAFSPDGKRVVSGSGGWHMPGELKMWSVESGEVVLDLRGHAQPVNAVVFHPDGSRLASCAFDPNSNRFGEVKLWETATGEELLTLLGSGTRVGGLSFSPDGRRLAGVDAWHRVAVWDSGPRDR
jgi:WD40 repeat protein/tRNA A-37 threonylcarbamoyl transferase component Bud32